ncbi:MAG: phytanoyl-CoA dioxygenase family protein [Alphaproteobacteria bacterium]
MNKTPLNPVTEQAIETYTRDGIVCLRGMFDAGWIEHLKGAVSVARTRPGPNFQNHTVDGEAGGFFSDLQMARRVPAFNEFMTGSPVAEIAGRLMRSRRVNLLHDAMWVKESGTSRRTPLHHDQPFYCMEGDQMCVVWVPLDPVAQDTALQAIPGSHRWGRKFRPERINGGWYDGYGNDDGFEPPPDVTRARRDFDLVSWDMQPGDCLAFHGMTLHGAPGNQASRPRRAVSFVMVGDDSVYVERGREIQPSYEGNGLQPGEPIDNDYFARLWTRPAAEA